MTFAAVSSSTQTLEHNSSAVLDIDTILVNDGNGYVVPTEGDPFFQAPVAGNYQFNATLFFSLATAGLVKFTLLFVNNTTGQIFYVANFQFPASSTDLHTATIAGVIPLNKGDTVSLLALNTDDTATLIVGMGATMSGFLINEKNKC